MVLTFNDWEVIDDSARTWRVRCRCGVGRDVLGGDVRAGRSKRCRACSYAMRRGVPRPEVTRHGLADSPIARIHIDMVRRCHSPQRPDFERYGGRGITVCDRWRHGDGARSGLECFVADMGPRPDGMQLDRRDNDGPYSPENCRWRTRAEQAGNTRATFRFEAFGRSMTCADGEAETGIPRATIWRRIRRFGWPPERALREPVHGQ